jgi:prepilin-type processing-associated H-X9-DG protein
LSYQKTADVTKPAPAGLIVTMDEHPDSINDAWMVGDVQTGGTWEDVPASYHAGAAGFSFADGHAELHKWLRQKTIVAVDASPNAPASNGTITDTPGSADLSWFTNHISCTITGNY